MILRTLAACLVLCLASPGFGAEMKQHLDVPYLAPADAAQSVDIYTTAGAKNRPIMFWIHGGGWQAGDKKEADHKPQAFVDRGYVFVSANYRLLPKADTIQQMGHDLATAVAWIREHAADYGGDRDRIAIMGHSAGAQLAALLCTDLSYLAQAKVPLASIRACIPVDGDTYDVPLQIATVEQRRKDAYRRKFGDEDRQRALSPITHVKPGQPFPPFQFIYVATHPEVSGQAERLAAALKKAGYQAALVAGKDTHHVKINADLGLSDDASTQAMFEFLSGALK